MDKGACDDGRPHGHRRFLPILGVFAGGLVNALLPPGLFGAHDFAARAVVTGAVAGVTAVLIFMLIQSTRHSLIERGSIPHDSSCQTERR